MNEGRKEGKSNVPTTLPDSTTVKRETNSHLLWSTTFLWDAALWSPTRFTASLAKDPSVGFRIAYLFVYLTEYIDYLIIPIPLNRKR